MVAASLGGQTGYFIGKRAGPKLFKKKDGILFRQAYITRSEEFYEKHGGKTVMIARFVPVVRTFAPVVAGMGNMDLKRFTFYNILGSAIWGAGITLLGYFFGQQIPDINKYIEPVIIVAMLLSFSPAIYHIVSDPQARAKIKAKFKR